MQSSNDRSVGPDRLEERPNGLALVVGSEAPKLTCTPLDAERLRRAKIAFSCRRVPGEHLRTLLSGDIRPRAGQLVLARIDRIRQHGRIERIDGRRAHLFLGDEVVLVYGNRYASDQFEGLVPTDLGPCHMVAAGGLAARMEVRNRRVKPATEITPLGLLGDAEGNPLSLRQYRLESAEPTLGRPMTIAVVGSAMNSGKTTSAAHLIRGFRRSGVRVGYAKVTGTGAGGDFWKMIDAGADHVVDFTDAGFISTYKVPLPKVEKILARLVGHLENLGAEVIVLEIADGVFQSETAGLMRSSVARRLVDMYLMAATDALSAESGVRWIEREELPLLALCGTVNSCPLAVREIESQVRVPVLNLPDLRNPDVLCHLLQPRTPQVVGA